LTFRLLLYLPYFKSAFLIGFPPCTVFSSKNLTACVWWRERDFWVSDAFALRKEKKRQSEIGAADHSEMVIIHKRERHPTPRPLLAAPSRFLHTRRLGRGLFFRFLHFNFPLGESGRITK
jgi:hypothetical protein